MKHSTKDRALLAGALLALVVAALAYGPAQGAK
jgi:hypothetical protein